MKQMSDLYSDYLLASFSQTSATGLSNLMNGEISHDQVTRFLSEEKKTSKICGLSSNRLLNSIMNPKIKTVS